MRKILSLLISTAIIASSLMFPTGVSASGFFRGGNFFDGGNRTSRVVDWQDPIPANPGDVVEFRVSIYNDGDQNIQNTTVRVFFPTTSSLNLVTSAQISSGNASSASDIATVQVSGSTPQLHTYINGHAKLYGPGCASGCVLPDTITTSGVTIGTVAPGTSNSFQIVFKAYVTNKQPTPTPTPIPTPNPTPTPATSSCTGLSASPTEGTAPLTVTFTGAGFDSNGSIASYQFNYGDSSGGQPQIWTQDGNTAAHRYENPGTFIASLLVKDSRGNWLGGNSACQLNITVRAKPQVLAARAPKVLPKTGFEAGLFSLALASLAGLGAYIYRRFKLL